VSALALFDTHCHLDYEPLNKQADSLLAAGYQRGIVRTLVPATTAARFAHLEAFVSQYPRLSLALGLHPIYLEDHDDAAIEKTAESVVRCRPVAVGEVGLDYFVETLDRERQQLLFEKMIDIATANHLPLVLHVRRSHDAVIATLRRKKFAFGGIVHAFAGSFEQAVQLIKLGFALGFGGVMTYESARRVRRLAAELALRDIVLETDAPDMKPANWPEPHNSPLALLNNFQALCALRRDSPEDIARATTDNAFRVLNIVR